MNQKIMRTVKFQQVYKECYKIFSKREFLLFSDFAKQIEWMQEILNSITYWEEQRYNNIVREYLSIKIQFMKDEEYIIMKNSYILQVM